MKISTKGRYALRFMLELAVCESQNVVSIKNISESQEISEKYLEQIVAVLKKADFIKSTRGKQGGYILTYPPTYYTVGMILRLTEGSMAPVACMEDEINKCTRSKKCTTLKLWTMIDDAVKGVIDKVTLEDMVKWYKESAEMPI